MESEKALISLTNDQKRKESSLEAKERLERRTRILKDRNGIEPTMRRQFDQIDEFRDHVKDFKKETIEMTKKYILDLEKQSKNERI